MNITKVLASHGVGVGIKPAGTAAAQDVRVGKTFINQSGMIITGNIPERGLTGYQESTGFAVTGGTIYFQAPNGIYNTDTFIWHNEPNLVSGNVRAGTSILGVAGKKEVVDTTESVPAGVSHVIAGRSVWANGIRITGTMPERGNTEYYSWSRLSLNVIAASSPGRAHFQAPTGAYLTAQDNNGTPTGNTGFFIDDPNYTPENILAGKTIFGLAGTAQQRPAYIQQGDMQLAGSPNQTVAYLENANLKITPNGTIKHIVYEEPNSVLIAHSGQNTTVATLSCHTPDGNFTQIGSSATVTASSFGGTQIWPIFAVNPTLAKVYVASTNGTNSVFVSVFSYVGFNMVLEGTITVASGLPSGPYGMVRVSVDPSTGDYGVAFGLLNGNSGQLHIFNSSNTRIKSFTDFTSRAVGASSTAFNEFEISTRLGWVTCTYTTPANSTTAYSGMFDTKTTAPTGGWMSTYTNVNGYRNICIYDRYTDWVHFASYENSSQHVVRTKVIGTTPDIYNTTFGEYANPTYVAVTRNCLYYDNINGYKQILKKYGYNNTSRVPQTGTFENQTFIAHIQPSCLYVSLSNSVANRLVFKRNDTLYAI
jgi:hypothetical protein